MTAEIATTAAAETATNLEVAAGTAVMLLVVFLIALWAQRTGTVRSRMISAQGKDWAEVFDDRLSHVEERQKTFEERHKSVEHDVKNIRTGLQALPSKDTVHRLEVQVARLEGKIETTDATVTSTARAVDRIENHLLTSTGTRDK